MAWTEKYVSDSGTESWATSSLANPSSLTEAIANYTAGERINVKAGTYSSGSTNREFTTSGTNTAPVWWRGYKTTPGDLDSRPTSQRVEGTDMPLFTSTTGRYYLLGDNMYVSNIHFTSGYTSAGTVMARGDNQIYFRCRIISTASSGFGALDSANSLNVLMQECYIENTTTGVDVIFNTGNYFTLSNCIVRGGDIGVKVTINKPALLSNTIIHDSAESNVEAGGFCDIVNCTLYNAGLDNLRVISTTYNSLGHIIGNVFDTAGGYAINQNTGTDTNKILIANNSYRDGSFGSGRFNGITESVEFESINETDIPFQSAGSLNFTLKDTAAGYGQEITYEVDGPTSYRDLGAIQHQDGGGGSAYSLHPLAYN